MEDRFHQHQKNHHYRDHYHEHYHNYVDNNNYWYTTGDFKIGSATNFINWNNTDLSISGSLIIDKGDILPAVHNVSNLGSDTKRFANIYSADLQLSNENAEANEVDGTRYLCQVALC